MKGRKALIAGASGLVGKELLLLLLEGQAYEKVYALVRKPLEIDHPKLVEVICDFEKLIEVQHFFEVQDVFCCLGTTIKKAKTKEAMYKVDVEYPIAIANLSLAKGAEHFLIISSMNANPKAVFWYPKMKGELEEALKRIPLKSLSIFRPSLLLGNREEFRLAESVAAVMFRRISFLLKETWRSKLAMEAKTVAQAMYAVAQKQEQGVALYEASAIDTIASCS